MIPTDKIALPASGTLAKIRLIQGERLARHAYGIHEGSSGEFLRLGFQILEGDFKMSWASAALVPEISNAKFASLLTAFDTALYYSDYELDLSCFDKDMIKQKEFREALAKTTFLSTVGPEMRRGNLNRDGTTNMIQSGYITVESFLYSIDIE